jgi:hypothetical protein
MPRPSSARTTTSTTRKTSETIAEARKKLAEAHEQGRHRKAVPNCPTCEQASNGKGGNGTKATSSRGNGRRKGVTFPPFREVTLMADLFMGIKGLDGDFDMVSCPRCACLLPAGDKPEAAHKAFHEQLDSLDQRAG